MIGSRARREDLPVLAQWVGDRAAQSSVVLRSDVFAHGSGVFVPHRDGRRGEPFTIAAWAIDMNA